MVRKVKSVIVALDLLLTAFVQNTTTLAVLITLAAAGCAGGGVSSKSPTPQPTRPTKPAKPTPTTPAGWVTIDRQYYSFAYPEGWKLADGTQDARVVTSATDAAGLHVVMASFEPGFVNQPSALNQCAGVDAYLEKYYEAHFDSLATPPGQYPYTTVTIDGIQPAPIIGGEETTVSVVTQNAPGELGVTTLVWLDAVPREGGIYLLAYLYPGTETEDPFRKEFMNSIFFKSGPLASTAYCKYLG